MRALQARGTGIETRILHCFITIRVALVAQMVERKTLNLVVVGSIPTGGASFFFLFVCQWAEMYYLYMRSWIVNK